MDAFTYTNIFATKGIEYLIIIAFLILIVPFWQIITRPVVRQKIKQMVGILSEKILRIPRGLKYSKNHTWTYLNKSGDVQMGIDDLLGHLLGKVEVKTLYENGDTVKKGDRIAELRQDGKSLDLISPISGKLISYNNKLISMPDLLNEEPYEKGWLANIEPEAWVSESSDFISGNEAVEWENKEFLKFKDFMAVTAHKLAPSEEKVVLQEGGEIIDNPMSEMPQEVWSEFQKKFLNI